MSNHAEVRFKLTTAEYLYLQGLARFFYDNRIIRTPSVHSLGKLAIRKIANEWIQVQTTALQERNKREIVNVSLFADEYNSAPSADFAPPSQTKTSNKKAMPLQK